MRFLDAAAQARVMEHYQGKGIDRSVGYGTVRDYCDSADRLPHLSSRQGDMKDLQRPWVVKTVLGSVPPGARLLEVGGGEPVVAGFLAEIGYDVTLVDPYDGSGGGPVDFEQFAREYPRVRIIRAHFDQNTPDLDPQSYDCVYSVSVLEHVHEPSLTELYRGIERFLRNGGYSIHAVDHVLQGRGSDFHAQHVQAILRHQARLNGHGVDGVEGQFHALMDKMTRDVETYYLSAAGHNLWRGQQPYEKFPFRKCVSIQTVARFESNGASVGKNDLAI